MTTLDKIVNLAKHPINKINEYTIGCQNKLKNESVLQLNNFLTKEAVITLKKESEKLKDQAHYCSEQHTILLSKKKDTLEKDDPSNVEVISDKGCVPHDLIPKDSLLNILYYSDDFKKFITNVLNVKKIYPYKDKLASINYNYYEKKQQLGWHFDNASFAITLMVSSPDKGGAFQYVSKGRDYEKNYIDKNFIKKIINESIIPNELKVNPGTLILFYGRNYLHRVTPVKSNSGRVLVTLNYNLEKGVELSKNAKKTFFGRVV